MVEKISKKKWNEFEKWKKEQGDKKEIEVVEPEPTGTIPIPEPFKVEGVVIEKPKEEPKEDFYTCSNSECNFDKITKDMKLCPQCNGKLEW